MTDKELEQLGKDLSELAVAIMVSAKDAGLCNNETERSEQPMVEWKDETSYSRNQTDRTPRIWSLDVNGIKIKVHKYVGCGDLWLISCQELGIDMMDSKSEDVGEAKKVAIDFVAHRLRQVAKRYQETACILKEGNERL